MNKIEAVIYQMKSLIDVKMKQKSLLIAEINELETMLTIVEKIESDKSIPNEEPKVSEKFLNVNNQ